MISFVDELRDISRGRVDLCGVADRPFHLLRDKYRKRDPGRLSARSRDSKLRSLLWQMRDEKYGVYGPRNVCR